MRWHVGAEYDESVFNKLGAVLENLGFNVTTKWSGTGGSQEITKWEAKSGKGSLTIEAETYIGLTIDGSKELVEKVQNEFNKNTLR